jgi:hypothetical protein
MRKFILLTFFIGTISSLTAQQTIFDLWVLSPDGCSLDTPGEVPSRNGNSLEEAVDWAPPPPPVPPGFASFEEVVTLLGERVVNFQAQDPEILSSRINWTEDRYFFRENGKWGLRDGEKVAITPRFDHVVTNKDWSGFVGYTKEKCNYYDLTGQSKFSTSYLHVEPTNWPMFIIRSAEGYGLLDEHGVEVLAPSYELIRIVKEGKLPYAHVYINSKQSFLYHIKTGVKTYYAADRYQWSFLNERYALAGNGALVDLQENRLVFCEPGIRISSVDEKAMYFKIARGDAPEEYHLIDAAGNLISKEKFSAIGPRLTNGMIVAAQPQPYEPGALETMNYGILNKNGEWEVAPKYPNAINNLVAGRFIKVYKSYYETSLVNLEGDTLLPFRWYKNFDLINEGKQLRGMYEEGKIKKAVVANLASGEVTIMEDPGYWGKKPFGTCGTDTIYLAYSNAGEMLLDANDEPVLEKPAGRIFKGPKPETYYTLSTITQDGKQVRKRQWINCQGEVHVFEIDGKPVDAFNDFTIIDEDFYFIQEDSEGGYFLLPNGESVYNDNAWTKSYGRLGNDYRMANSSSKIGLVNKDGTVFIPPVFEALYVDKSVGLLCYVLEENKVQYLKADGSQLFDQVYEDIRNTKLGSFRVKKNGKWGLLSQDGEVLLAPEYSYLYVNDGVVKGAKPGSSTTLFFDFLGQPLNK